MVVVVGGSVVVVVRGGLVVVGRDVVVGAVVEVVLVGAVADEQATSAIRTDGPSLPALRAMLPRYRFLPKAASAAAWRSFTRASYPRSPGS